MNDQQENNSTWKRSYAELDTRVGPEYECAKPMSSTPPWIRYDARNTVKGETQQEKDEMRAAYLEQIKLGIIKQGKNVQKYIDQAKDLSPQQLNFLRYLDSNPNDIETLNKFKKVRPKIKDNKTGKTRKIGPNDKCPCGSGKKYKKCHGRGL